MFKINKVKNYKQFTTLDPSTSKKMGRRITLRSDWESVKTKIMYEICYANAMF